MKPLARFAFLLFACFAVVQISGFTLAFFVKQRGDTANAAKVLEDLISRYPAHPDAYLLLGGIREMEGDIARAREDYKNGLNVAGIPGDKKIRMKARQDAMNRTHTGQAPNRNESRDGQEVVAVFLPGASIQ